MSLLFTLQTAKKIESVNKRNNKRGFGSTFAYKAYRDGWYLDIMVGTSGKQNSHGDRRLCVDIISYRKRLLDRDNLWASCKPILDGLKHFGMIRDDSEKWIDLACFQFLNEDGGEKTVINIYDQPPTRP